MIAEHFRHIKYAQLNSDVFTSVIDFDWHQIMDEYKRYKQVEGLEETSIYEVTLTLRHYERLVNPNSSKDITQQSLDNFVLKRGGEIGKNTLNRRLRWSFEGFFFRRCSCGMRLASFWRHS